MSSSTRFIFACGGTGGHIYPGIAVAQNLRAKGIDVSFIGNEDSMESEIVPQEGFQFHGIDARKIYRKLTVKNLLVPLKLVSSLVTVISIMRKVQPQAVFCTGSYVSGPVAIAAILYRTPLYFHESNSYPGLTIRVLARYSRCVFTAFQSTSQYLKGAYTKQVGIPLIKFNYDIPGKSCCDDLEFDKNKPIILVSGGSQGSQAINAAINASLPSILDNGFQLIWQTGRTGYNQYKDKYRHITGVHIFDFSSQLKRYYGVSRMAITRAGAMTIAELEQNHLPAILIPLPTAAENHQYLNAREFQKAGRGLLLEQKNMTAESILDSILRVNNDHDQFVSNFSKQPNTAAEDIAQIMIQDMTKEVTNAGKD